MYMCLSHAHVIKNSLFTTKEFVEGGGGTPFGVAGGGGRFYNRIASDPGGVTHTEGMTPAFLDLPAFPGYVPVERE